jgi:uncharacterized OsmC-like protein
MTSTTHPLAALADATGQAITDDPGKAHAVFAAHGHGTSGVVSTISVGRHTIVVDEPPALGGDDGAPNPVETALAGLLSCQVVTYRVWAAKLGIALDDVHIDIEGDLDVRGFFGFDDSVRPGFGEIRVHVRLTGPEPAEAYRRLQAAVDEHCPVLDLFHNPTPVKTTLSTT